MASSTEMEAFRDFMKETEKTVDSVVSLVSKVSEAVDKLYEGVEATSEALIKQNRKVRAAYQDLKSAVECALKFVKKVEALIRAGGSLDSGTDSMITSLSQTGRRFWILWEIPKPNYEDLNEFLEKIESALSDVEDAFLLFKESITTAINSTNKAALECKHCAMKAEEQRDKTKLKGTIASTGLAFIAGTVGGVLAGPVGAVIGAAAVGGIGGSTTIGIARHYENQRKAFNNQLAILNDWLESANLLNNTVTDVHLATVSLGAAVDQIQSSWWQRKQTIDTLCHDLITLNIFFSEIHKEAKDCSKSVHTSRMKIDLGLSKLLRKD